MGSKENQTTRPVMLTEKRKKRILKSMGFIAIVCFLIGIIAGILVSKACQPKFKITEKNSAIGTTVFASENPEQEYEWTTLGNFTCYAYCPCKKCCGKSDGITKTGTKVTAERTVAVDPKVIPLGSTILIDGKPYIAEDTGSAIKGNKIDIYFDSHTAALDYGKQTHEVKILR